MFRRLLLVFTDKELRTKLIKIFLLLIAARLLAHVPIPVLGVQDISPLIDSDQFFALLNTIAGGAYGKLSFVMLGVGPYITASIVIQLLGVIVPKIAEIQKEGDAGQQKINRWTRFLTLPLAALNGWGILQFLASGNNQSGISISLPEILTRREITTETFWTWFVVIGSMAAGALIMMWIGEIINEFKMGNGISLIILSGIVVRIPDQLGKLWNDLWPNLQELFKRFSFEKAANWDVWKAFLWENPTWAPVRGGFIFLATFLLTLLLVVFINDAVRKLLVVYSRRGHSEGKSRTMTSIQADLPVKVNIAGVLPIIFAVSFILFPTIISRFFFISNVESLRNASRQVENYLSTNPSEVAQTGQVPQNLPNGNFGFYGTGNANDVKVAQNYDTTLGQDLLGFTVSTNKEVKNVLFDGTFARVELPSTDLGFLPSYSIVWKGILAYTLFYFILIIFFTYFYTSTVAFKTEDVADNLQKSGAYIPGYRPGKQTQEYLSYVANRLNVAGSIFLAIIAMVPIIMNQYLAFGDGTLTGIVGGTTLLILVSVTIETLKQIEAQATAVDYERFTKY